MITVTNPQTVGAPPARIPLAKGAVEGRCQRKGYCHFPYPVRTEKEISMVEPISLEGLFQSQNLLLMTENIGESYSASNGHWSIANRQSSSSYH